MRPRPANPPYSQALNDRWMMLRSALKSQPNGWTVLGPIAAIYAEPRSASFAAREAISWEGNARTGLAPKAVPHRTWVFGKRDDSHREGKQDLLDGTTVPDRIDAFVTELSAETHAVPSGFERF